MNQFGKKTSVEADMYVKVQKNYSSIIRQLSDYLPKDSVVATDEFLDFTGFSK